MSVCCLIRKPDDFTLDYYQKRKRTSPDWIIPGLLKRENKMFLVGEPKTSLKSWLLLDLAISLICAEPVWDIYKEGKHGKREERQYLYVPPRPMRVVYFSQEDTEDDVHDRILKRAMDIPDPQHLFTAIPKDLSLLLDTEEGFALIEENLKNVSENHGPIDLVMFDPFRNVFGGNENDSKAIADLFRRLDVLQREFHCSSAFAHHTVKQSRDPRFEVDMTSPSASRGSGGMFGGADAQINVVAGTGRQDTDIRRVSLHFHAKRGPKPTSVNLQTDLSDQAKFEFLGFNKGREKA